MSGGQEVMKLPAVEVVRQTLVAAVVGDSDVVVEKEQTPQ